MTDPTILSRRATLGAAGALSLAALSTGAARADGRVGAGAQAAGYQRFRIGGATVTALLDGYIDVTSDLWTGIDPETLAARRAEAFLDPQAPTRLSVNAYVIDLAGRRVAVDAGSRDLFGPTAGDLPGAMEAAGIDPASVDLMLLTHMHPDHIGGLLTAGGATAYPNAELAVHAADLAYWTGDPSVAPEFARPWFAAATAVRSAYADRLRAYEGEADLGTGLSAVPLSGHTPGHAGYLLEDGDARLLFWGDISGLLPLQLKQPDAGLAFDVDGEMGAASRRRAFDMAASERLEVAGAHIPFPSLGHIARDGAEGLRFVPSNWDHMA